MSREDLSRQIEQIIRDAGESLVGDIEARTDVRQYADKVAGNAVVNAIYIEGNVAAMSAVYCNDVHGRDAFLTLLAVGQNFRRQGLAQALMRSCIADLQRRGFSSLGLEVRADNDPAIELYEKLGFRTVGESAAVKKMELSLSGSS